MSTGFLKEQIIKKQKKDENTMFTGYVTFKAKTCHISYCKIIC